MQALKEVSNAKNYIRHQAEKFFYFIACGKYDECDCANDYKKEGEICFGLLIYRIVCKNIYTIACLGVLGCAIALPFVSQLQSFLHLNHFVKLIFENNLRAIAKLTSVAFFSLPFIVFYLAQVIVSIKNLNHAMKNEKTYRLQVFEMTKEQYDAQRYSDVGMNYGEYDNLHNINKDLKYYYFILYAYYKSDYYISEDETSLYELILSSI
jgi:hypothetical protein